MKFTIKKNEFLNSILLVGKIIPVKSSFPMYSYIKLVLTNEGLTLTGCNDDLSTTSTIPCFIDNQEVIRDITEGSICVDNHLLTEIIRRIETEELVFEVLDDAIVQIETEKSNFKLNCKAANEYVELDFKEDGVKVELPAKSLVEAVNQVSFAASNKLTRAILSAIHIECDGSNITFTATDSARLARKELTVNTTERFSVNVPAKSLEEVIHSIANEDNVTLFLNEKKILFSLKNTLIVSKLIDGDYPNTKTIIPRSFFYVLEVNSNEILSAMDRISLFSMDRENVIKISMTDGEVKLSSRSKQYGSAEEKLNSFKFSGERLDISFNVFFVAGAIKALKCEDVVISFTGEMKPFTVSNKNDPTVCQLITPVRTF